MPLLVVWATWLACCSTTLLLLVAGAIKVTRPHAAAGSLRRSSARVMAWSHGGADRAARGVGAVEIGVGSAALFTSGRIALVLSGLVFALFVSFVFLTDAARRRGRSCGCWGSLSDGPAGAREVRNRVLYSAFALIPLAVRIVQLSTPRVPWGIGAFVVVFGVVLGSLLAYASTSELLVNVANAIGFGTSKGQAIRRRIVTRRARREVLGALRVDPSVVAVEARISAGSRLSWRNSRVTSPPAGGDRAGNFLVSVPGDGVNLRVVVSRGRSLMVIGESNDEVVTSSAGRVVVTSKRPTPLTSIPLTSIPLTPIPLSPVA